MAGTTRKDDALYMVLTALCMVVVVVHLLSHRRVLGRLASQLSQQDATLQQLMTRLNQVAATTANLESSQQDATPQQLMTRLNQVAVTMANLESCIPPVSVQSGGGMPASSDSPPGPRDTAMEQAVKELAGMHAQFFLICEDIKSLCTTAQYTCDFFAAQARVLNEIQTELEDLVRAHTALAMAVNQLLSKIADGLMPRGSPVAAKTDHTEATEDALEPPVTRLKQFRDAVESGLSNVSTQLVELQTLTAVQKTQNEKVAEGLGKVEGATSKMLTTYKQMQEALSTLETTGERQRAEVEKVEMAVRAKTTSLAEDISALKGQASQLHQTSHGLLRGLQKGVDHQANAMDSSATSLAATGGALSRPPVDSAGVVKLQDSVMSLSELVKELEVHMSSLAEGVGAVDNKLVEMKERLPDKP
ncbi:unnamed protein product [Symbiodinium microadriaticum]|nr:unnamed protein product [Symbiodinium microadriaticum]CAE7495116.1 unnamed protein product [Symbiodinium sp. KB8]